MSVRLSERQLAALEKLRRRFHQRSVGATLQLLLEEKLREDDHAHIGFRDSVAGREAHLPGTGLAIWEVMMILRAYGGDVAETARHLGIPETLVQAAITYATDFKDEIDAELAEYDAMDFEALKRLLPAIELVSVPEESEVARTIDQAR
jgi:uncharacterized protein (DUF433 family)